ncbi:hypothetical protein [Microbacterium sp. H6]|uniref:hypothetical protein n=1 Tax=Microbacterium sp. H6 TaxID=421122 RepID=UPI000DE52CE2|nr:hypothetical protein [Microbacterium sp. H6]RBO70532.1 hypothetical protein DSP71_21465 [Microbacterium sp. H6]
MASYSMSPYAISAAPRYARDGERRPITDLDGSGVTFQSVINGVLDSISGDQPHIDGDDSSRAVRVKGMRQESTFTFAELGVGRAGVEGTLYRHDDDPVPYKAEDHNEALVRSVFAFPAGGYEVFWMNERASNSSALSDLAKRLKTAFRDVAPDMTVKINPVVAWSAVMAWAEQVPVKELRFDAPQDGSSQAMGANGSHGKIRVSIKPQGMKLNRLVRHEGPDRNLVFGFLSEVPGVRDDLSADRLIQDGWEASVAFETPSGHQRSFTLGLGESAPSLIYNVGPDQSNLQQPIRPTNLEFAAACDSFLNDVPEISQGAPSVGAAILQGLHE